MQTETLRRLEQKIRDRADQAAETAREHRAEAHSRRPWNPESAEEHDTLGHFYSGVQAGLVAALGEIRRAAAADDAALQETAAELGIDLS